MGTDRKQMGSPGHAPPHRTETHTQPKPSPASSHSQGQRRPPGIQAQSLTGLLNPELSHPHSWLENPQVPSHCTCFRRGTWSRQGPSAAPAWASGSSSKEGSVPLQECQQVRKGDPTPLPEDLSAGRVEDGSGLVPPSCPMAGPHGSGQAAAPVPPSRVLSRPALGR